MGIGDWGLGIGPNSQSPFNNLSIYKYNNNLFTIKIKQITEFKDY